MSKLEHRAAARLTADWIGSKVSILVREEDGTEHVVTGGLSDFEVFAKEDVVMLALGGRRLFAKPTSTVSRGSLDL